VSAYNFPERLQTGNNLSKRALEPPHRRLLEETLKLLAHKYHYLTISPVRDSVGTFAYLVRDPHNQRAYLIAKASRMWQGIISCQAFFPNRLQTEKRPLMLALYNEDTNETKFYLFDSTAIIEFVKANPNFGYDPRFDVQMVNFSMNLAHAFDPSTSLEEAWKQIKSQ
jgi:hypothetical protein